MNSTPCGQVWKYTLGDHRAPVLSQLDFRMVGGDRAAGAGETKDMRIELPSMKFLSPPA